MHQFDWRCKGGMHSAWAIIEAENRGTRSADRSMDDTRQAPHREIGQIRGRRPAPKRPKAIKNSRAFLSGVRNLNKLLNRMLLAQRGRFKHSG